MPHVFISYRRDDSAGHSARLAERLRTALGAERVFFDEDSIEEGAKWEAAIAERMNVTKLLIVVIGVRWFDTERRARLANADDKLRQEIATALKRNIQVLPVLVDGARMPPAQDLPEDIRGLAAIQALPLPEPYFDQGVERILRRLRKPWRKFAAAGIAIAVVAVLAGIYGPQLLYRPSTYVVQVFENRDGATVADVTVRVKSLPSEQQDMQVTDAEGLARFQLRGNSILALGLEYRERGRCTGAKLPVFAAPALPAVTPVYLDAIPPRVKGSCGSESSDVSTTSAGTSPVAVTSGDSRITGDQGFLQFHLPWGIPAAPITVSRRPYVLGFDPSIKMARWVGYKVNYTGNRPRRQTSYAPDPLISAEVQAPSASYASNPYDRGNFVRRLDVSQEDEPAAFFLSVIAPQADRMNQGVWVKIEDLTVRESTTSNVWVLTGPAFLAAPSAREVVYPVLANDVPVPTHWFRLMVRRTTAQSLDTVSFLVPNTFTVSNEPTDYLTSIVEIERVTGLRLLAELPDAERRRIATRSAVSQWGAEP